MRKNVSRIEDDLHNHFCHRLSKLCFDTAGTCEIGGLDAKTTVSLIIAGLLYELLRASNALDMDHKDFLVMCNTGYRHMEDCKQEGKANARKRDDA